MAPPDLIDAILQAMECEMPEILERMKVNEVNGTGRRISGMVSIY